MVKNGIEYYMQTDKSVYEPGEDVEIMYVVTNLTETPTEIPGILNCYYAAHLVRPNSLPHKHLKKIERVLA